MTMAFARVTLRLNIGTESASFASSTLASEASQNWNVSRSRATSLSLVSVVSTLARCGAATPLMVPHRKSLPSAKCTTTCRKLICAGVGAKAYFSAGISSAAATRFCAERRAFARKASATGLAAGDAVWAARSCGTTLTASARTHIRACMAGDSGFGKAFILLDQPRLRQRPIYLVQRRLDQNRAADRHRRVARPAAVPPLDLGRARRVPLDVDVPIGDPESLEVPADDLRRRAP